MQMGQRQADNGLGGIQNFKHAETLYVPSEEDTGMLNLELMVEISAETHAWGSKQRIINPN